MSIKVMDAVFERSTAKGSALLLQVSIADHAHDDGAGAWPSVARLAKKTRLSRRQVQRLLRGLEEDGELVIDKGAGPNGAHLMTVRPGGVKMSPPDTQDARRV